MGRMQRDDPQDLDSVTLGRRFAGNAAWTLTAEVVGKIASFVFAVIVANGLGVRQYGFFVFAVSYVPLFLIFARWGLDITITREIARDRTKVSALFATGLRIRLALGIPSYLIAVAVAPLLLEDPTARIALAIIGFALFIDEIASFQGTVFRSFERMSYFALQHFVNRLLSTLLAALVLGLGGNLIAVAIVYALGSGAATAYGALMMRRYFPRISLRDYDSVQMRRLLREGVSLAFAGLLGVALFRVDSILLEILRSTTEVGLYGVAYRFLDSLLFVAFGLTGVALPVIARQGRGPSSARTFDLTIALLLTFYVPIAIGSLFASEWVVNLLFDPEFQRAASAVPWLTAAGIFYAIAYAARVSAINFGRGKEIAYIAGAALVLNLALNAYWIPAYGFVGAAAATLVAQAVEAICIVALYSRANRTPRVTGLIASIALASSLMGGVLWMFELRDASAVAIGSLVYLSSLWVGIRILAPREMAMAMAIIRPLNAR